MAEPSYDKASTTADFKGYEIFGNPQPLSELIPRLESIVTAISSNQVRELAVVSCSLVPQLTPDGFDEQRDRDKYMILVRKQ